MPSRQEVVNVLLAQVLQERGLVAAPEQVLRPPSSTARLPDVLIDYQGLRLMIEAEYATNPSAHKAALGKAQERVDQGIAHIGLAVVYPAKLQSMGFERLKRELEQSQLQFAFVMEATLAQPYLFPELHAPSFEKGKIDDLVDSLRRSYENLVRDETLTRAVALIEANIEGYLGALKVQPATTHRLAVVLGMREDTGAATTPSPLTPRERMAVNRISALIIVNAMIFQEVLAQKDQRVRVLQSLRGPTLLSRLRDHWTFILDSINYYPIFFTARELLNCLAADRDISDAVSALADTALRVVSWRASLRHDLAGRIFHRLLEEAKYLGAYYTSIPSAAILLKLALRPDGNPDFQWSDLDSVGALRIADLACGTGTLLMASADVLLDNYVRACARESTPPKLSEFHQAVVEKILYGYDVLASAIHLTASTLSLRVPDAPVNVTHLYCLPLGGEDDALGTLEFLAGPQAFGTLFGKQQQVLGTGIASANVVEIPGLDLCVMNPPFTRSVGGNLLFGNLPGDVRAKMQIRLRKLVKGHRVPASITAGLGSVFVALGDANLKRNGRLALVLPRALTSGVAWKPTRELINKEYVVEYMISSQEPGHWNFSENTSLSEVLVVARKVGSKDKSPDARTVCVNLWHQPRNAIEALSVVRSVLVGDAPDLLTGQGAAEVTIASRKVGEAFSVPRAFFRGKLWSFFCGFAQSDLVRVLLHLIEGKLYIPGKTGIEKIALSRLGKLGELGFDCRDMHDGFSLSNGRTTYEAIWGHGHGSSKNCHIRQKPNRWLQPLPTAKPGRPLRDANHLWGGAGRVLLAERLRLNTTRLTAVWVERKVLSNVWWPIVPGPNVKSVEQEKALVLWLNSTLGFLLFIGHRQETEGPWGKFKKPVLLQLPVLDVANLSSKVCTKLAATFDALSQEALEPFPLLHTDVTRAKIDRAIMEALGLPDFSILRELLSREPLLSLRADSLITDPGS